MERPENKHLVKLLGCKQGSTRSIQPPKMFSDNQARRVTAYLRKDKYNKKIKKYYVDVEEDDENLDQHLEKESHEQTSEVPFHSHM